MYFNFLIVYFQTAEERNSTVEAITDEVKSILEEMGHNFNLSSIRVMAFMLRKILCTLFRRVLINREGLERVRKVTISIHVKLLLQCLSIQFWAFVFFL